ncbi:MAG: ATP-binding protein [Pseudomonadota bacterium]
MPLRGNLFVRMFIGFWLVTIAVLGSWMLASNYFDDRAVPPAADGSQGKPRPPHGFMLRLMYQLESVPLSELPTIVMRARNEQQLEIYLFDTEDREILGQRTPHYIVEALQQLPEGRRRVVLRSPQGRLSIHEVYRRDTGPVRVVFQFQAKRAAVLRVLGGYPGLRVALAILVSGLACYGLSRMMTGRLRELQLASRRLANGELDTRLQVRETGGDETDELARDFNSMAGELQEQIQAQRQLLRDVSHELRSPLARLRLALALAEEQPDASAQHLRRIEHEAERLEDLIAQLLDTRDESLLLESHIDLVALLRHLSEDASFEGGETRNAVSFSTDLQQAIVQSTGDLLHKVFDNLLRNALSHSPEGERVDVGLDAIGDRYTITVRDQGPGVPENQLERIFAEFHRVDSARTRLTGGYGLGLAIARRAVIKHGGSIRARNVRPGLEVIVTLPGCN